MSDPAIFSSASPRHSLPFLFPGQVQKEFTVNEALVRIDQLIAPVIVGEAPSDPPTPMAGDCYLVSTNPAGAFEGYADSLAGWDGQQWTFSAPFDGLRIYDRTAGRSLFYKGGWQVAVPPVEPTGGNTVDVEARDAIVALVAAMRNFGAFS